MIVIRTSESYPVIIDITIRQPIVYLDYCVIADLTENQVLGEKFRNILLKKKGDIYFSWAHLLELGSLGQGPTFSRIRQYLDSFENNWLMMDNSFSAVIEREKQWKPGKQNAALAEELIKSALIQWRGLTPINLSVFIGQLEDNKKLMQVLKEKHEKCKKEIKDVVDSRRLRYRDDKTMRDQLDREEYFYCDGKPPTTFLKDMLVKECIRTNEAFNPTDSVDLWRCVVATA